MIAITSSVFDMKLFISSFGRAFRVMGNGVCFTVVAFLFAWLFKILVCASRMTGDVALWTRNDVK